MRLHRQGIGNDASSEEVFGIEHGERVFMGHRRSQYIPKTSLRPRYVPLKKRPTITIAEKTVLKPGHVARVRVTSSAMGLHVLLPKQQLMVDRQIQVANGVANMRPNVPFFVEVSDFRRKLRYQRIWLLELSVTH